MAKTTSTEVATVLTTEESALMEAITLKKEEIYQWVETANSLVVTAQTLKEADAFRKKGKNYRLEIQRIIKGTNDRLLKIKRANSDRESEWIDATGLSDAEKALEGKIKAIEQAQEAERLAKLQAEEDRKRGIMKRIKAIDDMVAAVRTETNIEYLTKLKDDTSMDRDSFEEFNENGNGAIDNVTTAINNRIGILKDEEELKSRTAAKVTSRKELLANYPQSYWPTDEQLGSFTQEEFEEAIVHIDAKLKADDEDQSVMGVEFEEESKPSEEVVGENIPFTNNGMMWPAKKTTGNGLGLNWRAETLSDSPDRRIHPPAPKEAIKLNNFEVNGYWFGLDEKIPFDKAVEVRQAIEKVLSS